MNVAGMLAVVNIGQLVTLAGPARPRVGKELSELGLVENAALIIEDGRITAAGANEELRSHIPAGATVIDAEGCCVTPGFVDAHTHLVFAGNRAAEFEQRIAGATYQEIAAAGGGIQRTVRLTRAASEEALLKAARRHRDWMLRCGTTTIEAKSGYGLDRETELRMLRVLAQLNAEGPTHIVSTLLAAHMVPPEFTGRREEYIRWICEELIPEVVAAKLSMKRAVFSPPLAATGCGCVSTPSNSDLILELPWPRNWARRPPTIWRPLQARRSACCAKQVCSRYCCRARFSHWDASSIRLRGRWLRWVLVSCWPPTLTQGRHQLRRCRLFFRWPACRCVSTLPRR
jgi:hypothetical protein